MKRITIRNIVTRTNRATLRYASLPGLLTVPLALVSCGAETGASETPEATGAVAQACHGPTLTPSPASCGYRISADYISHRKKTGYNGQIELINVAGDKAGSFEILADLNGAAMEKVHEAEIERQIDGAYLLKSPKSLEHDKIKRDETYEIKYKSADPYAGINPYVISINGVRCDTTPPTVSLDADGSFYTASGNLTLTATASDDVAVRKVVLLRDGAQLAVDTQAPYRFVVPVSDALNGRHRYTAVAYDPSGNTATSNAKSVFVSVGNKFFGTEVDVAADYSHFTDYFSQLTPGNAGKWGGVEAVQDQMDWSKLDTAYQYAKQHNAKFKFHTLIWGQQQPSWIANLPADQQLAQIDQWMTQVAARYPAIDMIDVVNEPLHAPPSYAAALGGAGETGWDWVIKAFQMARAHFPSSELILNDYNVLIMPSFTSDYLKIVNLLKDRGLIDGIGEQGHFLERADLSVVSADLAALAATGLPIYISELDLNLANDARQAQRMSQLFPIFWSNPSVVGVTHWGYVQGAMWQPDSYLLRSDGTQRPALDWLVCYRTGGTNCPVPVYVPQPRTGDLAGITLQAEDYDVATGLMAAGNMVAYANDGSWLSYSQVAFNDNWDSLSVSYAQGGTSSINLTFHLGSLSNAPVATVALPPTGDWTTMKTVSIPWAPTSGTQDLYVRFDGGGANVDKFQLAAPAGTGQNLIKDGDFELGTIDSWWSWGGGTIANTTSRAVSGARALAMTARSGNSPLVETLTSAVLPGKTYKVDLWATIGGASASAYVTTALQCTGGATTYGRIGGWSNAPTLVDGTWAEFAGDLQVPDCPLANVAIWLEGPDAGVDLYIDHASVRQYTSSNVIQNGTFESGTTGWFTFNGGSLSATAARAHAGTQSLLVSNRASNAPAATDLTSVVKPATNYPFSLWVSIHSPDASSKSINATQAATCKAADGSTSTAYSWVGGPVTVPDGNTWTQISGTVAVPNCNLTQFLFWVEGGAGADLYVDDAAVTDDSGGSSNLIPDGTFESGQGAWGGWGYASLGIVTTAHSGVQSLKGGGMQSGGAVARDIRALVAAGKRYQATAWVSVGNLTAGSGLVKWQTVQNCDGASSDSYPWLAGATVSNGAWAQVTGVVDLSACKTLNKLLLFAGADSGDLYLDDVALTPLP